MKFLKNLTLTAKYMLLSLATLYVAFALVGSVIILFLYPFETISQYLFGLSFGCFVTAVRTILMDRAIAKTVDLPQKKAEVKYQGLFFIRYGILILFAVILVLFRNIFGLWGGILGILCLQFSAYGANYLLTKNEKKMRAKTKRIPTPEPEQQKQQLVLQIETIETLAPGERDIFDVDTAPIEKLEAEPVKLEKPKGKAYDIDLDDF